MDEYNEFEDSIYEMELQNGFSIIVWDAPNVCDAFKINTEQLEYLVKRTEKQAGLFGVKKSYNLNFIYSADALEQITVIGMYLIVWLNKDLKTYSKIQQYLNYFKDEAIRELLRYQGFKK